MLKKLTMRRHAIACAAVMAIALVGCDKSNPDKPSSTESNREAADAAPIGPDTSPVKPVLDKGWCGGHGVPESVCTRCDKSLIETFKTAGDWCKEHKLPESQCTTCHPEVADRWATLNPANAKKPADSTGASDAADALGAGPASSPVKPTLDEGWCGGHGVPESVCTRCNDSLTPIFKTAGDWCDAHDLPDSQCFECHPEYEAQWSRLNPDAAPDSRRSDATHELHGIDINPGGVQFAGKWCPEHGVPESVCTRCDASLIEGFKNANDWCAPHRLPESQCAICNPEVRAKWAALRPDAPLGATDGQSGIRLERSPRLLTGSSDPLCQVDSVRVAFLDPGIVSKAGIVVTRAERREISATCEVPAEVEFNATRLTRVTSRVAGVVLSVPAEVGDTVQARDLLAVIDSPVLGEAKSQFIERSGNLYLATVDLDRISTVHRGIKKILEICTPDAETRPVREALATTPIGDAKAKILRAHAALQLAKSEAQRATILQQKKINSDREFQAAQSALAAAEADFAALREEVSFSIEQERLTAERGVDIAQGKLDSARRRLHILGLSAEQIDAIGSESAEDLSRLELRSPVAGRVITREVAKGEFVETSDVLFVVVDQSDMWLMADVYERDLLQLRPGLPLHFSVDGLPGVSFGGHVSWISSRVDDRTRTVKLRAELPNPDGLLRAGMFGRARIVLHENEKVVGVPVDAVQTDGCCQLVFVQESETEFQPRKVVLGSTSNGFVEVLRGISEGEAVVSVGSYLMKTEILKGSIGAGCCEVEPGR